MSLSGFRFRRRAVRFVALCSAPFALLTAFYGCIHHALGTEASPRSAKISVLPARDGGSHETPALTPKPVTPLTVSVDATQSMPADPQALQAALVGTPLGQGAPDAAPDRIPPADWLVWGHLTGPRVPTSLDAPAAMTADALGVYAVSGPECRTVCLINRSQEKLRARVVVHLPRGIYTIERLTVMPHADHRDAAAAAVPAVDTRAGGAAPATPASDGAPTTDAFTPVFRLERLEGRNLARQAIVAKSGILEPGQVVFYRYTDQSRVVDAAFAETYRLLVVLEKSRPGPAHRLRRMLREGEPYRSGARPGSGSAASCLQSIHQLLMVTGQAQSLHHNYQVRGTVEAEVGAALMGSLERVIDGLAEVSATLLDLVPQVTVAPAAGSGASGRENGANTAPATAGHTADYHIVTVALANGGEHSVEMVKLGLDNSELPSAIVCDPADPAFFGTLRPGQTVRATFRLRCPAGAAVVRRRCVADVCYRAGGGPAHLRPRPW